MYGSESGNIQERFERSHNGQAAARERSDLIDAIVTHLWDSGIASAAGAEKLCIAALGGYGRRTLFPHFLLWS